MYKRLSIAIAVLNSIYFFLVMTSASFIELNVKIYPTVISGEVFLRQLYNSIIRKGSKLIM